MHTQRHLQRLAIRCGTDPFPSHRFLLHGDNYTLLYGALKAAVGDIPNRNQSLLDLNDILGVAERGAAVPFDLEHHYLSPAMGIPLGYTSAGRHPVLDENGNPTGEFYRDAPDFWDSGASIANLVKHPGSEWDNSRTAIDERLRNPKLNSVERALLQTITDPAQIAAILGSKGATFRGTLAEQLLADYGNRFPGYNALSPELQDLVKIAAGVKAPNAEYGGSDTGRRIGEFQNYSPPPEYQSGHSSPGGGPLDQPGAEPPDWYSGVKDSTQGAWDIAAQTRNDLRHDPMSNWLRHTIARIHGSERQ